MSESLPLPTELDELRRQADQFIESHNTCLPDRACPFCATENHLPGLACEKCGYIHPVSWAILRPTEWGYDVVALNNSRNRFAGFSIEEPPCLPCPKPRQSSTILNYPTASTIYNQICASQHDELRGELFSSAAKYADLRIKWQFQSQEGRNEMEELRMQAHNVFISCCDILSRAMGKSGENNDWIDKLGKDRKVIGDFACYVHLFLSLSAR